MKSSEIRTGLSFQGAKGSRGTRDRGSDLYLCKTRCQREINATDRQIDQLVYELYGLTEKEVKILEKATGT